MSAPLSELAFVVPALDGAVTGGTLFNRELCTALAAHAAVRVLPPDAPAHASGSSPYVWVDSLFLAHMPELARRFARPCALFLHYLPSFVRLGRAATRAELSEEERAALDCATALWVPSAFMRDALGAIVAPPKKIHVLEPGTHARLVAPRAPGTAAVRALCVGNVTSGKGYLDLLHALGQHARAEDSFELRIVGSITTDEAYAAACLGRVRAEPALAARARFLGELSPMETLSELARADLFVSASRMESYGMALAEARVSGVPIVALEGGNVRAHVAPESGGKLARNHVELATLLLELARSPELLRERGLRARSYASPPRAWVEVAREFLGQLAK